MFFQTMADAATGAGVEMTSLRDRYTRFKFYPQREFAQALIEAAGIFYAGVPLRTALRKMGYAAPRSLIESVMGRVIFGSVNGTPDMLEAMAKTYPLNVRPSRVDVLEKDKHHVIVQMHNVPYFLDCHHVGVFEGTMKYAGQDGSVKIRSHSPVSAVNRPVKTHSAIRSAVPCSNRIAATLSSDTATTLRHIAHRSATSKDFPAGVSASKITSWSFARQGLSVTGSEIELDFRVLPVIRSLQTCVNPAKLRNQSAHTNTGASFFVTAAGSPGSYWWLRIRGAFVHAGPGN
jgi:uncharacterized protein (TIGR02265 family)